MNSDAKIEWLGRKGVIEKIDTTKSKLVSSLPCPVCQVETFAHSLKGQVLYSAIFFPFSCQYLSGRNQIELFSFSFSSFFIISTMFYYFTAFLLFFLFSLLHTLSVSSCSQYFTVPPYFAFLFVLTQFRFPASKCFFSFSSSPHPLLLLLLLLLPLLLSSLPYSTLRLLLSLRILSLFLFLSLSRSPFSLLFRSNNSSKSKI